MQLPDDVIAQLPQTPAILTVAALAIHNNANAPLNEKLHNGNIPSDTRSSRSSMGTQYMVEKLCGKTQKLVKEKQERQQQEAELKQMRALLAQRQIEIRNANERARQESAELTRLQQVNNAAIRERILREAEALRQQQESRIQQLHRDLEIARQAGIERQAALTRAEQAQAAMVAQIQGNTALLQQFRTQTQTEIQQFLAQNTENNRVINARVDTFCGWCNAHTHHLSGACDGSSVKVTCNV